VLDPVEVDAALDLARRGFAWLVWTDRQLQAQRLHFDVVRESLDDARAAEGLVRATWPQLPREARPPLERLDEFARYVASYLATSFEALEHPHEVEIDEHSACSLGARTETLSHLRPKRVNAAARARAKELELERMRRLAREEGLEVDDARLQLVLEDPALRDQRALSAYVEQLLARLRGEYAGPEVLALWRTFAWTATGAPKQDFELDVGLVRAAEERLVARLRSA
jgi:hypothetical protein